MRKSKRQLTQPTFSCVLFTSNALYFERCFVHDRL